MMNTRKIKFKASKEELKLFIGSPQKIIHLREYNGYAYTNKSFIKNIPVHQCT